MSYGCSEIYLGYTEMKSSYSFYYIDFTLFFLFQIRCFSGVAIYFGLGLGLGLRCFMSLSTIFQLYRGGQFLRLEETGVLRENHRPVASQDVSVA
jgi:hypothetical protein